LGRVNINESFKEVKDMKQDLHNVIRAVRAIEPVAAGTTGTGQVGQIVDRSGYSGVEFVIGYGAITATSATYTVRIKEGDATSAMTSVADADLIGTEADAGVAAAARVDGSTEKVFKRIGYKGNKRYVQCSVINTATAATPVSAACILHSPDVAPTSNP
jgi:hypothetical protein